MTRELYSEVLDRLGYLVVCAPNIPSNHELTLVQQFERLETDLAGLTFTTRGNSRRVLEMALSEVRAAEQAFGLGDVPKGKALILAAEEHVRASLQTLSRKEPFVVSPAGEVKPPAKR